MLVDSASLSAREVGRIAQTCKKLNEVCMEDSLWASFCQREYPATRCFSKQANVLNEGSKGYRLLYKSWSAPVVKRRPPANKLGPPSCRSHHLFLAINMKYNGTPIYAAMMNLGTKIGILLETGSVKIKVSSNVSSHNNASPPKMTFGKAVWDYGARDKALYVRSAVRRQHGLPVKSETFDPSKLDVRIHLYRSHDNAFSCLFSSRDCTIHGQARALVHPEDPENITLQSKFDLTRDQRIHCISLKQLAPDGTQDDGSIRGWPLQHTHQAALIMQAFPHPLFLEPHFGFSVLEDGDFAITRIALHVMTKEGKAKPRKFKSKQETGNHGVTLHHVFSELQGT